MRNNYLCVLIITLGCFLLVPCAASAQSYQIVFVFTGGPSGVNPLGPLVADAQGNLYGATANAGLVCGTVFDLNRGISVSILWNFQSGASDGCQPNGGMVVDAAGNIYGTTYAGGVYGLGTVFELSPNGSGGWAEKILWNFGGFPQDGLNPIVGLTLDSAGNLYGTTPSGGGSGGCGIVFELSPNPDGSWAETVLHSFGCSGKDGSSPMASVTLDSIGNLYGTTLAGGGTTNCTGGCGTVFELHKSSGWKETQIYVFGGGSDGASPYGPVIFDHAGRIYGTASGPPPGGVVFQLVRTKAGWKEIVLHTFGSPGDGNSPGDGLAEKGGSLYGVSGGGTYGKGTVFKLTHSTSGWTETVLHSFGGEHVGGDGAGPTGGVTFYGGKFYGTTATGGADNYGTIYEVTP